MNSLAKKFFQEANFEEVRIISEEPNLTWEEISECEMDLPRGWFELSRIQTPDRIEFVRDFWLSSLPFHPMAHAAFADFFSRLDDIAVLLRKEKESDFFSAELVYSLGDESSFFRGLAAASEQSIIELKREVGLLPRDYLAFVHMHNGFGKLSALGLFKIEELPSTRRRVMELLLNAEEPVKSGEVLVDAGSLIPFYEEDGLFSFQCFYSDWYPGSEMGNVYLSGIDYTISDTSDRKTWIENFAFPTFLEWLAYYVQGMNAPILG